MAAEFFIKAGDDLPRIETTLTDGNNVPVDIAQADVYLSLRTIGDPDTATDGVLVLDAVAASNDQVGDGTDGTMGQAHYDWELGDTDIAEGYLAEWKVVFALGGIMTFPNNNFDLLAIMPNLAGGS
jgi:hypothetical protein